MRLISFAMTQEQVLSRTKTVTRRSGWKSLQPGTLLRGVHKCMGFRKGERPRTLAVIRVVDVRRERLDSINDRDVELEGYPGKSAGWFVDKFCRAMRCDPSSEITRIEFEYIPHFEWPEALRVEQMPEVTR